MSSRRARPCGSLDNKLQAYRYANLRPNGMSKAVTLFTVPTSAGVATLACVDPSADCEAIANTLKLNAGTAFPVGPSKDYAAALSKTLGGLDKKVAVGAQGAAEREDAEGAGRGREAAASAYKDAVGDAVEGRRLARPTRPSTSELASALKQTGGAYGKLASAAWSGNKGAYRRRVARCSRGGSGGPRAADDPGGGLQDRRSG